MDSFFGALRQNLNRKKKPDDKLKVGQTGVQSHEG